MANHAKQITPTQPLLTPEPPEIEWGQIVKTDKGYHLATMRTRGQRIVAQDLGAPHAWRPVIEAEFQRWAVERVLDRNEAL